MARLPYTNFHDLNLDWVLRVIKKAFTPDNPPPYPVKSVNGKTGDVTLTGGDIPFSEDFQQATVLDFCDYALESIDNLNVDVASKQDAPILIGSPGQVLGLDADQTPVWLNQPNPESIIDDNAGLGDTTKVYSADHITGLISPIIDDISDIEGNVRDLQNTFNLVGTTENSKNLYNPQTNSIGTINNDGTFNPNNTTWITTDYIYVGTGNTVSVKGALSYFGTEGFTQLAYYTADKTFINRDSCFNANGKWTHIMTGTQAYIRLMANANMPPVMVNIGNTLLPYEPYLDGLKLVLAESFENQIIDVVKTNGLKTIIVNVDVNGGGDYTSLRDAIDYINALDYEASIIYIAPGTYDISSYYTSAEMSAPGFVGLKMPINCQLIGTGDRDATIITLTLPTQNQLISTLNIQSNFTMKNLTVYGENTEYTIHDDFGYAFVDDHRLIENCKIIGKTLYYANAYGCGNTRNGAYWIFRDCIFTGDACPFSNHNGTGTVTKNNIIEFINCRFINTNSVNDGGNALMFRSLSDAMGIHWTLVNLYGCKGNGKIIIGEENPSVYGAGLRFRVTGYADTFGQVVLSHTDSADYSDIVDII